MQAWNETNRILCQTSKKRSHDFKNHETFYLYIRFYILLLLSAKWTLVLDFAVICHV